MSFCPLLHPPGHEPKAGIISYQNSLSTASPAEVPTSLPTSKSLLVHIPSNTGCSLIDLFYNGMIDAWALHPSQWLCFSTNINSLLIFYSTLWDTSFDLLVVIFFFCGGELLLKSSGPPTLPASLLFPPSPLLNISGESDAAGVSGVHFVMPGFFAFSWVSGETITENSHWHTFCRNFK